MAIPFRHTGAGGREEDYLVDHSLSGSKSITVQGRLEGGAVGEKNVGVPTHFDLHHGQPAHHKTYSGVLSNNVFPSPCDRESTGNECNTILLDFDAEKGSIQGDVEADRMEFDGRGEAPTSV